MYECYDEERIQKTREPLDQMKWSAGP